MNDIIIKGTEKLPSVNLDASNGVIEIAGRSIPEDGKAFYDEVLKWIKEYSESAQKKTEVTFKLEYLNSSSHISIKNILSLLEELNRTEKVQIVWHYEEDDPSMHDTAKNFSAITRIPFELVAVKDIF